MQFGAPGMPLVVGVLTRDLGAIDLGERGQVGLAIRDYPVVRLAAWSSGRNPRCDDQRRTSVTWARPASDPEPTGHFAAAQAAYEAAVNTQNRKAATVVAGHCDSVEDCSEMLAMLGLEPLGVSSRIS